MMLLVTISRTMLLITSSLTLWWKRWGLAVFRHARELLQRASSEVVGIQTDMVEGRVGIGREGRREEWGLGGKGGGKHSEE